MRALLLVLIAALAFAPARSVSGGPAAPAVPSRAEWEALAVRYRAILLRDPDDAHARYSLAIVYAHEGRVMEGYRELQAVDRRLGARRDVFSVQVVADAQRILAARPNHVPSRYRLAFALWFQGRKEEARAELERLVALEPEHPWSLGYLGYAHADAGDLDTAVALWERGIALDPANAVLHYVLALAYTRKGQLRKAAAHFAAAYRDRTLRDYVKDQEGP